MNYESLSKSSELKAVFIAEAGINHDGSLEKAKQMVDTAVKAGAGYVKFQSFKADKIVIKGDAPMSSYHDKGRQKKESFYSLLKRLELTKENHLILKEYCDKRKIKFLSTAFDEDSFDLLLSLKPDMVKVASGELTNIPLLRHMAGAQLPMIVSTGMATLGEIEDAVGAIMKEGNDRIVLMHCLSWYPSEISMTNLKYMDTLRKAFGFPVGYSDHTLGINMSIAARALGAVMLEKHFTLKQDDFGCDHEASINPEELCALVRGIRQVESGLGNGVREFHEKEWGQRRVHRRSVVLNQAVKPGQALTAKYLTTKRPGTGIMPKYINDVVGKKARRALPQDHVLAWSDLE